MDEEGAWKNWIPLQKCLACKKLIWQGWVYAAGAVCKLCEREAVAWRGRKAS